MAHEALLAQPDPPDPQGLPVLRERQDRKVRQVHRRQRSKT